MERYMSTIELDKIEYITLGDLAEGTIEPRSDQSERLEEFTQRVGKGEFHIATSDTMLAGCIDGRCGCSLKPNTAGGTETLMVADDLINQQFRGNDGSTATAYANIVRFLKQNDRVIGGHDDEGRNDEKTGCGANDKLPLIYAMIGNRAAEIRALAESIGMDIDDTTHNTIVSHASSRTEFSSGPELYAVLDNAIGEDRIDHLRGSHNEVLAVINMRYGTSLDRDALEDEFGSNYEAFNVDAWAFSEAANVISTTDDNEEARQKSAAMAYYNLATAMVLGGPGLRITVLK